MLNRFRPQPDHAARYALAALAGLLLTASFPTLEWAGLGWVAPGLILFSALGADGRRSFRVGYIAGLVHFLSSLRWLLNIPYTFHGVPLGPAFGCLVLSAYLALFPALWVWLAWKLWPQPEPGFRAARKQFAAAPFFQRQSWALACAASWVALEMVRARLLTGFPWNFLGVSQYRQLPLIQIASITGVYGVSFLVAWGSICILSTFLLLAQPPPPGRAPSLFGTGWLGDAAPPLLAVAGLMSSTVGQLFIHPRPPAQLQAVLIQPSFPQSVIWDANSSAVRFRKMLAQSAEALKSKPDLLIWPESAADDLMTENIESLTNLVTTNHVWMILCADDADPPVSPGGATKYYNAAFLVAPDSHIGPVYRKRRLVMFGEYVPLARWLPFLKWFMPGENSGYSAGTDPVQFHLTDPPCNTSVLICFEDSFPQEARNHVQPDTDFLVNLTNDGWFGEGPAQWQHTANALFRAVENGVPLIRCTNTGLTCWIDPQGRIHDLAGAPDHLYGPATATISIPLRAPGAGGRTFYNQHGDLFGWACVIWSLAKLAARLSVGRGRRSP